LAHHFGQSAHFYSDRVHGALLWMVGGLAARSWHDVTLIVPYTLAGLTLSLAGAYYLNLLQLGDDMARGLGLSVERARLGLTAIAPLLAASAVSVAGLLGLRRPYRAPYRAPPGRDRLPLHHTWVGSSGMAVVTWCDTAARLILAPVELPVGIIMAFIGAPFFLFLLRKEV
jgi:iron complex transport system permease protein